MPVVDFAGLTTGEGPRGRITLAVRSGSVALRLAVRLGSMSCSSAGNLVRVRDGPVRDHRPGGRLGSQIAGHPEITRRFRIEVAGDSGIGDRLGLQGDGRQGIDRGPNSTSFGAGERPLSPRSVGITSVMIEHSAIRGRSIVTSDEMVGAGPGGCLAGDVLPPAGLRRRTIVGDIRSGSGRNPGRWGSRSSASPPGRSTAGRAMKSAA